MKPLNSRVIIFIRSKQPNNFYSPENFSTTVKCALSKMFGGGSPILRSQPRSFLDFSPSVRVQPSIHPVACSFLSNRGGLDKTL